MRSMRKVVMGFKPQALVLFILCAAATVAPGQQLSQGAAHDSQASKVEPVPLDFIQKTLPDAMIGVPFRSSVQVIGGEGILNLTVGADVPPGMVVETEGNTVVASGVPEAAGIYQVQINASDTYGASINRGFTIHVYPKTLGARALSPVNISDAEALHISDADDVFFPVVIGINENITVADTESELDSALIVDNEALTVTDAITVSVLTVPTITWPTPAAIYYGTALSSTQLDATSTVAGTFVYSPVAGTVLAPGNQMLSVSLMPTNTFKYVPATKTVQLMVDQASVLTSPTPGSKLAVSTSFTWSTGSGVTLYDLELGTTQGSFNLYNSGHTTATSAIVSGLPTDGSTIYAQLFSYIGGVWKYATYTYTAAGPPALTSPAPGSLLGTSATFTWSAEGTGVTQFDLWLGTTGQGSSNLYNSGHTTATSANVTGLPTNGSTVYAEFFYYTGGAWKYINYTFISAGPPAIISPTPGTVLGASANFVWSPGIGATMSELTLGTTGVGSSNLFSSGATAGNTATVTGIPTTGATVYAQLGSYIGGAWQYVNYTYTETAPPLKSALITPAPGSVLGASANFTWTIGSQVTFYDLSLGTTGPGSYNLYNSGHTTATSASVTGLPSGNVTIYAQLWSYINGVWQYTQYTFVAEGPPGIISPTPGSVLGTGANFVWSPGIGATLSELTLGTTGQGSSDLYSSGQTTATTDTVTGIPTNGSTIYAQLGSYNGGAWQYSNYTYSETALPAKSVLINPTAGSVLGASANFTWSVGSQVTLYDLWVGTTGTGSSNLYNSGHTTAMSSGAISVPQNGETVYVQLFSYINGAWQYSNYAFKAHLN